LAVTEASASLSKTATESVVLNLSSALLRFGFFMSIWPTLRRTSALVGKGLNPEKPRDAAWGERYFHMPDPDGHELSFARPI
jgi:hypothetical protein